MPLLINLSEVFHPFLLCFIHAGVPRGPSMAEPVPSEALERLRKASSVYQTH